MTKPETAMSASPDETSIASHVLSIEYGGRIPAVLFVSNRKEQTIRHEGRGHGAGQRLAPYLLIPSREPSLQVTLACDMGNSGLDSSMVAIRT